MMPPTDSITLLIGINHPISQK